MSLHNPISHLRAYYVQKVLPAVYDDSLSYYEILCKVQETLNDVVSTTNEQSVVVLEMQQAINDFIHGGYTDTFEEYLDEWFEENSDAFVQRLIDEGIIPEVSDIQNDLLGVHASIDGLQAEDTAIRSDMVTADASIRNDMATADASIRNDMVTADAELTTKKVPYPLVGSTPSYGTNGQVLSTNADGTTDWQDPVIPSDAQAEQVITQWLNAHPEATTTVQDGAITDAKLANGAVTTSKIANGSVTDDKLAQSGGVLEKVSDLKSAFDSQIEYDESIAFIPLYGKNLAKSTDFESEKLVRWDTGETSSNSSYDASGYVRVMKGELYGFVGTSVFFAFYDSAKNYVGKVTNTNSLSDLDGYGYGTTTSYGLAAVWFKSPITGFFRYSVSHNVDSARRVFMAISSSADIVGTSFPAYTDEINIEMSNNPEIRANSTDINDIENTLNGVDFHFLNTPNLFDETNNMLDNYYIDSGNGTASYNTSFECVNDFIDIGKNQGYICVLAFGSNLSQYASYHRCAFYDNNKSYISGVSNGGLNGEPSSSVIEVPQNARYFKCGWRKSDNIYHYEICFASDYTNVSFEEYEKIDATPKDLYEMIESSTNGWMKKIVLTYGDSITAINNPESPTGSWGQIIEKELRLTKVYGRGVGGQTFVWNNGTFEVNSNGEYVNRGTSSDNCLGCFCSWQRITSMIPASIKDTIDLIIIMGGTNDFFQNKTLDNTYNNWKWKDTNTTDPQWVSSSGYYNGGDFDISIFQGAVASTIMKMQKWCPNALVVLATPLSGASNGTGNKTDFHYIYGKTTQVYADAVKTVAEMFSVPLIDVYGTDIINPFNRGAYIADNVHPYNFDGTNKGCKALARAMISGMNGIYPIIK